MTRHNHPAWGKDKLHDNDKPKAENVVEHCAYCHGPILMRGWGLPTYCPQCGLTIESNWDIV